MNSKFLKWYSQALGSTLGLVVCIYSYLNGDMFVYNNIGENFDSLSFGGMLSSYTLFPLCILTLLLSIIKSYTSDKVIFKISLDGFNLTISIITVMIGLLGTSLNFIIPSLLVLLSPIVELCKFIIHKLNERVVDSSNMELATCSSNGDIISEDACIEDIANFTKVDLNAEENSIEEDDSLSRNEKNHEEEHMFESEENDILQDKDKKDKKYLARKNMAIDLIEKNASIDFISDISGLTLDEINHIINESKSIDN